MIKEKGMEGEEIATLYLQKKGYTILERNYRMFGIGEIDIICKKGERYIFVEVKFQEKGKQNLIERIDRRKRECLQKVIFHYIGQHQIDEERIQCDIVLVRKTMKKYICKHYEHVYLENFF